MIIRSNVSNYFESGELNISKNEQIKERVARDSTQVNTMKLNQINLEKNL